MSYERFDVSNGEGIRSSVFFAGCSLKCKGCWNPSSWNPKNGDPFTIEVLNKIVEGLDHPSIAGLSLLGGEPFENLESTVPLVEATRDKYGDNKNVWAWSGHTFDKLISDPEKMKLLKLLDVLVEGPFILAKRDLSLRFRGSSNQRVLDVKKSLAANKPILYML